MRKQPDPNELEEGYRDMAADEERQAEAFERVETVVGETLDIDDGYSQLGYGSSEPPEDTQR